MRTRLALGAGALAFLILATANSGGYRYGVSDQAFYIPAIAHAADASLFPRDSALLAPQMRLWLGDEIFAVGLRTVADLPTLFAALYIAGVLLLFGAAVFFVRGLGGSWWAVAGATALLTLRHRIPKTGANSLEGYMHPRMIAFAIGLVALGCLLRQRFAWAVALVALAAVVHPTTALWFGGALAATAVATLDRRSRWNLVALLPLYLPAHLLVTGTRMDAAWLAVLGEKDYLFPSEWPAYAWLVNLMYPVVLCLIFRRRSKIGVALPAERTLIVGLVVLVAGFVVSVPLAAAHIATVVQLQVNRVFWILDAAVLFYVAWWLIDDVGARRGVRVRTAIGAGLLLLAMSRGAFVLVQADRPLGRLTLPHGDWTDTMAWIGQQPADWLVLADPGHAWKFGTSVRVAALRDTVLEQSKDSAMALYDRSVATRVAERAAALASFDAMTPADFRAISAKYGAQVLVAEEARKLDLPVLYANARFAVHDIRR